MVDRDLIRRQGRASVTGLHKLTGTEAAFAIFLSKATLFFSHVVSAFLSTLVHLATDFIYSCNSTHSFCSLVLLACLLRLDIYSVTLKA